MKKIPSLFRKKYTEKKLEKKLYRKLYVPEDKNYVKSLFEEVVKNRYLSMQFHRKNVSSLQKKR